MWYYFFPICFSFSVVKISTVLEIVVLINSSVVTGIHRPHFCEECSYVGCICRGPTLNVFSPYALAETSRVAFPHGNYFSKLILTKGAVTNTAYNNSGICARKDAEAVPDIVFCQTFIDKARLHDHTKHLKIIGVPYLTIFSKNALSLFQELERLSVSENVQLTNVPAPHAKGIKSITHENNNRIETVSFDKTFELSSLENFTYMSHEKSDTNLTIEKINVGTKCRHFNVSVTTNDLTVQLPICENIAFEIESLNVTIVLPRFRSTEKVNVFNVNFCPDTKGTLLFYEKDIMKTLSR